MNDQRFDDVVRRLARGNSGHLSRRGLLRAFGFGAVVAGRRDLLPTAAFAQGGPPISRTPTVEQTAFDLDYDPDRIFRFVRDEVDYDAYAGVLRGAQGTLWGLAGNSADRALLLAALLNAALFETRFVVGELSGEAAARLLDSMRRDARSARERAARVILPPPSDETPAPLTAEAEELARALPGFAEQFRDAVERQVTAGVATVLDALTGAGIALPEPEAALPERESRQHVWLQYAFGSAWVDLDPVIPGSEPGDLHATPTATLDRLPDELFHRVSFRLVAEQVVGGAPARRELLAFEAPSSELVGVPITLSHPQPEAMRAIGMTVGGVINGYRNFVPLLLVGDEPVVTGASVTFGTGGGVLGALGDGGAIENDTLAEWLEIAVRTPEGERRVVRELFDRVGAERRAAGPVDPAAVPPLELGEIEGEESSFLPLAGLWSMAVVSGPVPATFLDRDPAADVAIDDLARLTHAYHFARDVFSQRDGTVPGYRTYLDEPNVTALVLRSAASGGAGTAATGLDLLHRGMAAVPLADAGSGHHPLVAAGVLGHAVERAIVESAGEAPLGMPVGSVIGVGRLFEEAERQGVPTLVLRLDDPGALPPPVGAVARRRIGEALAAGYVVIVPERPVALGGAERTGWWLVDPATGATVDQMDDGGGMSMAEFAVIVRTAACVGAFVALAAAVYYTATYASLTLVPGAGEGASNEFAAADAAAARAAAASAAGKKAAGTGVVGTGAGLLCAFGIG